MDQKPKFGKTFRTHKPQPGVDYTHILYGHNSPAAWARELFKPSKAGVLNLFEHVAQLINKKGTMAQRLRNYSSVTTAVHVQNINKNNI